MGKNQIRGQASLRGETYSALKDLATARNMRISDLVAEWINERLDSISSDEALQAELVRLPPAIRARPKPKRKHSSHVDLTKFRGGGIITF